MESQHGGHGAAPATGRSARKRAAVVEAARELFLQRGYAHAGMDDIAARAGVSKQTVYAHFVDKERLFTHVVELDIGQAERGTDPLGASLVDSDDLARDLRTLARRHLDDVMQPRLLRMRRMIIGEADRFPGLAGAWYSSGPERSCAVFAEWFAALAEHGRLRVPDPDLAAQHFNWLVLSIPVNRAMAVPSDEPLYTPAELDQLADEGVRVFLAAYGA